MSAAVLLSADNKSPEAGSRTGGTDSRGTPPSWLPGTLSVDNKSFSSPP